MLNNYRGLGLRTTLTGCLAALALVALAGCSDEAIGKKSTNSPQPPVSSDSSYALKVLVQGDGESSAHLVRVGAAGTPPPELASGDPVGPEQKTQASSGPTAPGTHPLATIERGDGSPPEDTRVTDAGKGLADGWTLMHWALRSCLRANLEDTTLSDELTQTPIPSGTRFGITGGAWAHKSSDSVVRPYYFFYASADFDPREHCDAALFMQEGLVCAADHLAQLADSPGTVTWDVPGSSSSVDGSDIAGVTITIPPQDAKDVFIARDLALNALAYVAQLDSRLIPGSRTCSQAYLGATTLDAQVFGPISPVFDPGITSVTTTAEIKAAARRRLVRKAMVLSSSARLVDHLVEGSVNQDISGAQQFLSAAGKSQTGAAKAWGVAEGQDPGNTLRHAVKTLFGRLEIGNHRNPQVGQIRNPNYTGGSEFWWSAGEEMRDDPKCNGETLADNEEGSGSPAIDSLLTIGGGLSARWDDTPPASQEEALATSALDGAGIVLPPALNLTDSQLAGTQGVIVQELMRQAGARLVPPTLTDPAAIAQFLSDLSQTAMAKEFVNTYSRIGADSWRVAAARVYGAFRLLTHSEPATGTASQIHTSLLEAATTAGVWTVETGSGVPAAGGVVVVAGMHRDQLGSDPLSRFANPQINSNCATDTTPFDFLSPWGTAVTTYQNPFLLGQALQRHLGFIASQSASTDPELASFSAAAVEEVRGWAGPGWMVRQSNSSLATTTIQLVDVLLGELGVKDITELRTRLKLVDLTQQMPYGVVESGPVIADCVAGLRTVCPHDIDSSYDATLAQTNFPPTGARDYFEVRFPLSNHAQLVVLAEYNGQPGRVLGTLPLPDSDDDFVVETLSQRQRELANRVLGASGAPSITRTCSSIAPLSQPQEYCIEGMGRDQFVPLANSITSSGSGTEDSFKHYLDVAEQASGRADQLGKELIDIGIQRDLRAETASEEVSQLCGAYPKDALGFGDAPSDEAPTEPDQAVAQCTNPTKIDLVFLRHDPFAADATPASICNAMCGAWDSIKHVRLTPLAPFCLTKCNSANPSDVVRHTGLDLGKADDGSDAPTEACNTIPEMLVDNKPQMERVHDVVKGGLADPKMIMLALSALHLKETADNEWVLLSDTRPLMGTRGAVMRELGLSEAATPRTLGSGVTQAEANTALADVYPLCAEGSSATCPDQGLGAYFAKLFAVSSSDAADTSGYYPDLRRQVERALFFAAALAGGGREGQFQVPMPFANRTVQNINIPAPAYYAPGKYTETSSAGLGKYDVDTSGYDGSWPAFPTAAASHPEIERLPDGSPYDRFLTDRAATDVPWQSELFNLVKNMRSQNKKGAVLFTHDPVDSAALKFNEVFDPVRGSKRENLGEWLIDVFSRLNRGELQPADVQQLTFYQAENAHFCHTGDITRGRQVCASAPVSPLFFSTTPSARVGDAGCTAVKPLPQGAGSPPPPPTSGVVVMEGLGTPPDYLLSTHRMRCQDKGINDNKNKIFLGAGWFRPFAAILSPIHDGCQVDSGAFEDRDTCREPDEDGFTWALNHEQCSEPAWDVGINLPNNGSHCAQLSFGDDATWSFGEIRNVANDRLRSDFCQPSERVELFVNQAIEADSATAGADVLRQALGMACATDFTPVRLDVPPPAIKSLDDAAYLERWTAAFAAGVS